MLFQWEPAHALLTSAASSLAPAPQCSSTCRHRPHKRPARDSTKLSSASCDGRGAAASKRRSSNGCGSASLRWSGSSGSFKARALPGTDSSAAGNRSR
eukprot:3592301-Prymnesium_polylepis.1